MYIYPERQMKSKQVNALILFCSGDFFSLGNITLLSGLKQRDGFWYSFLKERKEEVHPESTNNSKMTHFPQFLLPYLLLVSVANQVRMPEWRDKMEKQEMTIYLMDKCCSQLFFNMKQRFEFDRIYWY